MTEWIDLHAHLDKLQEGPDEALRLAREAGVARVVTIGTDPEDLAVVVELTRRHPGVVYGTLGIHPHEGVKYTAEIGRSIERHLSEPGIIAVGEIGLDYHYDQSPREEQRQAFRAQLDIAARHGLPVEIHTRDAEEDTVAILNEFRGRVTGIIHCFTGTRWLAERALDLGFNISISGIVTFKNAEALRDVVRFLPIDRLHVETDSPFLAPVPLRGKQNTPAFMVHTAKFVAELKGMPLDQFQAQMRANALRMFPKLSG
ncbi:MAG: TatD family hydrolase [Bdellovibrionaceae bacterium]|nr:TatD family hydrolase [Pseudobdellovibrionaceae bacterium]MBX3033086.1 TatD family hydrolase [Pseudobdellovibrionaceae bacterium]